VRLSLKIMKGSMLVYFYDPVLCGILIDFRALLNYTLGMKKLKRNLIILSIAFTAITFIAIALKATLFWPDFYLFINDTPNRIDGDILGSTSPAHNIDISAGKMQLINVGFSGAELLKAYPVSKVIQLSPMVNFGLLKIVWISKMKDYPNE